MRIGLNAGIFGGTTVADAIERTAAAGADGCELNIQERGPLSLESEHAELEGIRRLAAERGIQLPSVHCGLHWRYPLSATEAETRERGVAALLRSLEIGAELGAGVLLVVPGVVTPQVRYADAYRRAQEGVARLARHAETLSMRVAVENVWNRFLLSPLEMARFIDEQASPAVGAYFDVGNILAYGFPQDWIATLGARIAAVHVKDYRSDVPGGGGFVTLLEGDVPWAECVAGLRAVGFDGFVTAELPPYRHLPERTAPDTVAAMRAILDLGSAANG